MDERNALYLRPTLIIGLGGSGSRIAVELKARLEERLGESSNYRRVVKFLCFDTANENFTAQYPNAPEVTVSLSPESEFVRISDVPLHDLMRSRGTNEAIDAILPNVLYTTQIDQGAQQVRRLGRIALFHHYGKIKEKLTSAINALRQVDVIGHLGDSADGRYDVIANDRNRLRIFIVCSICGGTGSGTFIDMAYLVRHIAEATGINPQACDVNGMLLLPEAFPNIVTTGAARIRANAYAALLDMEYYNQAVNAEKPLYEVRMPGETIRVSGSPFSICYLVGGGGNEGPVGDVRQLAPLLADALDAIIASPIGIKLDATLDNVRVSLSLDYDGFRTFYSALGIAQIVHPEREMRQAFMHRLKGRLIEERILRRDDDSQENAEKRDKALTDEVDDWIRETSESLRQKLRDGIRDRDRLTRHLSQLEREIAKSNQPVADFEAAFRETVRIFQENVEETAERAIPLLRRETQDALRQRIYQWADDALEIDAHGFWYGNAWLNRLLEAVPRHLERLQRRQTIDLHHAYDRELSYVEQSRGYPVVGPWLLVRGRVKEGCANLHRFVYGTAIGVVLQNAERAVFAALTRSILDLQAELRQTIAFWDQIGAVESQAAQQSARPTVVTQYTLPADKIRAYTESAVEYVLRKDSSAFGYPNLQAAFLKDGRSLSRSFDPDARTELLAALHDVSSLMFSSAIQSANQAGYVPDVTVYLDQLRKQAGERERYNALMVNLRTQAQPLLIYSAGLLAAVPPTEIRIVGGNREDVVSQLWSGGATEQRDINFASTYDPTRLTYVVTHHGIPINALAKFDEYRSRYEELKPARNAIFHLDEERENEPHDPKSTYFINLEDFQSHFARALAYKWIKRVTGGASDPKPFLFVASDTFYAEFSQRLTQQQGDIKNQIEAVEQQEEGGKLREDQLNSARARKHSLQCLLDELNKRIAAKKKTPDVEGFSFSNVDMNTYALPLLTDSARPYAQTLSDAIAAFYSGSRLAARVFLDTVIALEKTHRVSDALADIDDFLQTRHYAHSRRPDSNDQFVNRMLFSEPGQDDYKLELHLCAQLAVYRRLRLQRVTSANWIPAGYHLLEQGYLRAPSETNDGGVP